MRERKRNRLYKFDYSSEAIYFLTSCVQDRICCLGNVENGKMILNSYGKIANEQILWLEERFTYFKIHNHVVMPNHVHILCEIIKNGDCNKIKSTSELIGAFKTTSSKQIHLAGLNNFSWQRSFHDHIIRDYSSFENIYNYITRNPEKWDNDTFYNKMDGT